MSSTLVIQPAATLNGVIRVPGDKSISHRAVLFAGLAQGSTEIDGFLASEDCLASLAAIQALGARSESVATDADGRPARLRLTGTAGRLNQPAEAIDCGNSGTTMRLLAGILAGQPLTTTLTGDASLSRRPMNRVAVPLTQMGARFEGQGEQITAPLTIHGVNQPTPIHYPLPVASAQVKSAVLLCGLNAEGNTTVVEPAPTRDHTERMLAQFGISLLCSGTGSITLQGPAKLQAPAQTLQVPADISSAAFWLVAAAARSGHELILPQVGLNPTRNGILAVLQRMGAQIEILSQGGAEGEPFGDLRVSGSQLHGTTIAGREIPNVIDELPVLAVAAALAQGVTEIRDAQELRVKESDRIALVVNGLQAMGAQVEELPDGMRIHGGTPLHGATIDSNGDHRIGMAFAIAGLFASSPTTILNAHHIATSYPTFARDLERVTTPSAANQSASAHPVIALDGPAASGKSSVAQRLAQHLGYAFVGTGSMYRAVTHALLQRGIDTNDAAAVTHALRDQLELESGFDQHNQGWLKINGQECTEEQLSSQETNAAVSAVASVPAVREALVALQRRYAADRPVVMEGRDIGTVVFPQSRWKFYITASEEVRAARRQAQGQQDDLAARDQRDSNRQHSPLTTAPDAFTIDSTELTLDQTVETVLAELQRRGLFRTASSPILSEENERPSQRGEATS